MNEMSREDIQALIDMLGLNQVALATNCAYLGTPNMWCTGATSPSSMQVERLSVVIEAFNFVLATKGPIDAITWFIRAKCAEAIRDGRFDEVRSSAIRATADALD